MPAAGVEDLDADEQIVVYRIVQEGLSNVARHAAARNVRVDVERPSRRHGRAARRRRRGLHAGRRGARARARGACASARVLAGGRFCVDSAPGRGTTIELRLGGGGMRLVIADDHGVVRGGLRLLLDRQPDMEVVGEAADGAEAVAQTLAHRPDIAILDVAMPRLTGLQATREIKALAPDVDVLILSMHDDERYLFEALKAGRVGLRAQARGRPLPRRRGPRGRRAATRS